MYRTSRRGKGRHVGWCRQYLRHCILATGHGLMGARACYRPSWGAYRTVTPHPTAPACPARTIITVPPSKTYTGRGSVSSSVRDTPGNSLGIVSRIRSSWYCVANSSLRPARLSGVSTSGSIMELGPRGVDGAKAIGASRGSWRVGCEQCCPWEWWLRACRMQNKNERKKFKRR